MYTTKTCIACQWLRTREDSFDSFILFLSLSAIFRAVLDSHPAEHFNAQTEFCSLLVDQLCLFPKILLKYQKYLKIPCNKWCFHDDKQQLTGRLKTTTCFTVVLTHGFHLDRYIAPSVGPYAWKEFGSSLPKPWQAGGLLPSTWGEAPLPFQMHEMKSVSSGQ